MMACLSKDINEWIVSKIIPFFRNCIVSLYLCRQTSIWRNSYKDYIVSMWYTEDIENSVQSSCPVDLGNLRILQWA